MIEIKDKLLKGYKFIDLFAGIGGFHLALESLGAECIFACEWDKHSQITYKNNYGMEPYGDITQLNEKEIPTHDILCGGFPCQAFSVAGNQLGFNESRGTLFFDIARIAKEKQPKVIFMENVKNLLSHDSGNTFKVIKNTLEEIGYNVYYSVLAAKDYGVPQLRQRIYIVCFRKDLNVDNFTFPQPFELKKVVEDILLTQEEIVDKVYIGPQDRIVIDKEKINNYDYKKSIPVGSVDGKTSQGYRVYSPKGVGITLCANGGGMFAKTGGYYTNGVSRTLAPRECARIMGFPDSFIIPNEISKAQQLKQFGNSVVVDVLQYIGIEIGKVLENA